MILDPKRAWQVSVEGGGPLPLGEVRKLTDKFYRAIRRRNMIEYVASMIVIVVFTGYIFTMPHLLHKVGSAMVVAAAIYAPWQLHRRASAVAPESAGMMPTYAFLRSQFVRQRNALTSLFWWYVLPFLPGIVLFFAGNGLDPAIEAAGPPIWVRWSVLAGIAALIAFIVWLNRLGARRLQKRIDEIDALTGESGDE